MSFDQNFVSSIFDALDEMAYIQLPTIGEFQMPDLGTLNMLDLGTLDMANLGTLDMPDLGTLDMPDLGTLGLPALDTNIVQQQTKNLSNIGSEEELDPNGSSDKMLYQMFNLMSTEDKYIFIHQMRKMGFSIEEILECLDQLEKSTGS